MTATDTGFDILTAADHPEHPQPEWLRTALRADDGRWFIPAAASGGESVTFLCACQDGVPYMIHEQHPFVLLDWMVREYPELAELADTLPARFAETAA